MTIRKHPQIKVRDADLDYDMFFDVSIENGVVTVDCEVENYDWDTHHGRLLVRASDLANAATHLAAFSMGLGATVVLERSSDFVTGKQYGLVFRDRPLQALCTSFSHDDERFDAMLDIVFQDIRIARAIRDLTESLAQPHLIPSLCARAMETLRVIIVPPGVERKLGWPMMQERLNVRADYLKSITDYGVGPRHGDHEYVPASATRFIANRSWAIMNRFLEYKKRGSLPLPLDEFPLLTA